MADEKKTKSKSNLMPPWKPGQSGNPGGRKKGRKLSSVIDDLLERSVAELQAIVHNPNSPVVEAKAASIILNAHPAVLQQLWDRHEGTVTQKIESKVEGAAPVQIYIPDNGRDDQAEPEAREVSSDEG